MPMGPGECGGLSRQKYLQKQCSQALTPQKECVIICPAIPKTVLNLGAFRVRPLSTVAGECEHEIMWIRNFWVKA